MIVFVSGTGTEVGKTWVSVRLLAELRRRGHQVAAWKPAQSFSPDELGSTDAELLAAVTDARPQAVCPDHRWYAAPMAPPMAAEVLGAPAFTIADLARETPVAPVDGIFLVEGAGGPRSPLAADGDNVDLARAVGAGLAVLIADAGLGTINAVRLCVDALTGFDTLVLLNRFDAGEGLHGANLAWLRDAGYQVLTSPEKLADAIAARLP